MLQYLTLVTMNVVSFENYPSWLELLNMMTASLLRGETPTNKCPVYDTKPSDGEAPVLEL